MSDMRITVLSDPANVEQLCEDLRKKYVVGIDTESEEPLDDYHVKGRTRVFSVQFAAGDDTYFVPTYGPFAANFQAIKRFVEDKNPNKAAHHGKHDWLALRCHGLVPAGLLCDTFVAEYTAYTDSVHPDGTQVYRGLKYLSEKYFGYKDLKDYDEEFSSNTGKRRGYRKVVKERKTVWKDDGWGFEDVQKVKKSGFYTQALLDVNMEFGCERMGPVNRRIVEYACKDPWLTVKLFHHVKSRLDNQPWLAKAMRGKSMWDYYYAIERKFTELLVRLEWNGAHLDPELLPTLDKSYEEEEIRLQREWEELCESVGASRGTSWKSNDELAEFLTQRLGLTLWKQTASGKPSVDKKVLEELVHPAAQLVLQMRSVHRGRTTYVKELLECFRLFGGYVHASYHQCGTRTWRLSSSDPNQQNIPSTEKGDKKTEAGRLGRKVRQVYNAPAGKKVWCIDLSQIEGRMAALYSKDKALTDMIINDWDMHSYTTINVFDNVKSWVGNRPITKELLAEIALKFKDERAYSKNVRFASQYKAGGKKIAAMCKVEDAKGYEMHKAFWNMHYGLKTYGEKLTNECLQRGFITTILGRYGWVGEAKSRDERKASTAAFMKATSTQFQGSVADWIKLAMILIDENCPGIDQTAQIHDELVGRAEWEAIQEHGTAIEAFMSEPLYYAYGVKLWMPTPADLGSADNWADAKAKGADGWRKGAKPLAFQPGMFNLGSCSRRTCKKKPPSSSKPPSARAST